MAVVDVKVPNIGDFEEVAVIELLVGIGDTVKADQSLITVESDKASMEIPSSHAGVLKELRVKVGDKVREGSVMAVIESEAEGAAAPASAAPSAPATMPAAAAAAAPASSPAAPAPATAAPAKTAAIDIVVPDIGDFADVAVIEVMVEVGDTVKVEQSLITVESDKASMEIPSSHAGVVTEVKVKVGDRISKGSPMAVIESSAGASAATASSAPAAAPGASSASVAASASASASVAASVAAPVAASAAAPTPPAAGPSVAPVPAGDATTERIAPTASLPPHDPTAPSGPLPHASPSIRKAARELGVPLAEVKGSGPKGRITLDDVNAFVKAVMAGTAQTKAQGAKPAAASAAVGGAFPGLLPWPVVDFAKFGAVERKDMSRIKKISAANLHRNWVLIPHVTNHDDADITELEAFRLSTNKEHEKAGIKVTMLAFLIKACVAALKQFPDFNASLDGEQIVLKKYFHIGFAADTPNGLMVPVIRDADQKGVLQISQEMSELAKKAREGKLSPAEMTGGCFSISSLGGIGGRYFTPIINAPEVAILGVCKSSMEPVWDGKAFQPRLMLPLSLSWDHRVVDGASAARFNATLCAILADFRRVLL